MRHHKISDIKSKRRVVHNEIYLKFLRATYLIMHFANALKTSLYLLKTHPKMAEVNGNKTGIFLGFNFLRQKYISFTHRVRMRAGFFSRSVILE